jgi:predicted transcriptional regulator
VQKTTLYLPDDLKTALGREARQRGVSEARLIRDAIAQAVTRPVPQAGIIATGQPLAERADEYLEGFGER